MITGGYQNFAKTDQIISTETEQALAFPYHTFTILDTQTWIIAKQHTLVLNPQEYTHTETNRDSVVQTLGGAYVDDFGRGLSTVTVSGHTGWRLKPSPDGTGMQDGWQAFKSLRDDVWRYFTDKKDNVRTYLRNPQFELRWYNWGEEEYYSIQPHEFTLSRSVSQPLFHTYNFRWTCLRDLVASGLFAEQAVYQMVKSKQVADATKNMKALLASITQ